MLCLFEQDFLKYYTKAGMDTEELEVGVFTHKGTVQNLKINKINPPMFADGRTNGSAAVLIQVTPISEIKTHV